ncbi:MAG TPA: hypothetical protein VEA99_17350 [Gemmatimonadaceae bacterium]|nr:hypothetical protein [Gemmatimonadaceae bacterium]
MNLPGAVTIVLALAGGADDRLLLCKPEVLGDPAQARGEAVAQAAGKVSGKFLEYGAVCKDAAEGSRAARRAGLDHAVVARAEGTAAGARFQLLLADAPPQEDGGAEPVEPGQVRAQRTLEVRPGDDAVPPLRGALKDLLKTLPPKPGPDPQHVAAWTVAGVGAAAILTGVVVGGQAEGVKRKARDAEDPASYTRQRKRFKELKERSNVLLGAGGAAVAAGLTWRFAF